MELEIKERKEETNQDIKLILNTSELQLIEDNSYRIKKEEASIEEIIEFILDRLKYAN